MISYETVLNEIEKHIQMAKSAENLQQLREHLSAIRALCDVGLVKNNGAINIQKIPSSTLSQVKVEEDDANGPSIFDF